MSHVVRSTRFAAVKHAFTRISDRPNDKDLNISTSPAPTWSHAPDHCAQSTHLHTLLRVAVPNARPGLTPLGTCVLHADGASLPAEALANATGRTQLNDAIVSIISNFLFVLRARSWAHCVNGVYLPRSDRPRNDDWAGW